MVGTEVLLQDESSLGSHEILWEEEMTRDAPECHPVQGCAGMARVGDC